MQRDSLNTPVSQKEIFAALKDIGNLKSPRLDGFGAIFLKANWEIAKVDVITSIFEFFEHERLFKAFICTIVSLIPMTKDTKYIKDFRPIILCTTTRLGKVLGSIISNYLVAFIFVVNSMS